MGWMDGREEVKKYKLGIASFCQAYNDYSITELGQERAENFGCVVAISAMESLMKDCGKDTGWPVRGASRWGLRS